ncbi:uncharacterized protein LOC143202409 [Rhynchophorus ferrugineus]|uniref:uncharacterized protein LOC143202409 n=1 Tax=Rhynchophorus ferrugineus TaxID=354439 RepID=UPI003FCE1F51
MDPSLKSKFGRKVKRLITTLRGARVINRSKPLLPAIRNCDYTSQRREYGKFIATILREALRIRFLIFVGAILGGTSLYKKYNTFKESIITKLTLVGQVLPDTEKVKENITYYKNTVKNNLNIDPRIKRLSELKYNQVKTWSGQRLTDTSEAIRRSGYYNSLKTWGVQKIHDANKVAQPGKHYDQLKGWLNRALDDAVAAAEKAEAEKKPKKN